MSTLKLGRDPFARQETRKVSVHNLTHSCNWCGASPLDATRQPRPRIFQIRVDSDGGRSTMLEGAFCSMSCARSYHA